MAEREYELLWTSKTAFEERERRVLWCDEKHLQAIEAIKGVCDVAAHAPCCYTIGFDPRYNMEDVVNEIVAVVSV